MNVEQKIRELQIIFGDKAMALLCVNQILLNLSIRDEFYDFWELVKLGLLDVNN